MADAKPRDAAESSPAKGPSLVGLIVALVVISVVVAAESIAAFLLIPAASAGEGGAPTDPAAAETAPVDPDKAVIEQAMNVKPTGDALEVDLEHYAIHTTIPTEDRTLRIDFHLYALVGSKDAAAFEAAWPKFKHRLRDRVIAEFRQAGREELADPELHLIKRRILAKSNAVLGKPWLQAIVISEFRCVEQ